MLAVVSGLILTLGWFLRPRESNSSLPSETDSLVVERLARRRAVDGMSEYFAEVAEGLAPYVVWLESLTRSGVIWEGDGTVVTSHGQSFAPGSSTLTYGGSVERTARVAVGSPLAPIAAYRVADYDGLLGVPRLGPEFLDADVWLLAVWRPNAGNFAFAPGIFVGTRSGVCGEFPMAEIVTNIPLGSSMVGAGLFDLDGALVGVVVGCPEGPAAMAVGSVESALLSAESPSERVLKRYGFLASPPATDAERQLFGDGAPFIVSGVWFDTSADRAGLLPGDVVTGIAGADAPSLGTLAAAAADQPLEITVLRDRRELRLTLTDTPRQPNPAGVQLLRPGRGIVVQSVDGAAAESGMRAGDALLSIGGQTVANRRDATRLLGDEFTRPAWVVVRRGPSLRGFVISPPPRADTSV